MKYLVAFVVGTGAVVSPLRLFLVFIGLRKGDIHPGRYIKNFTDDVDQVKVLYVLHAGKMMDIVVEYMSNTTGIFCS